MRSFRISVAAGILTVVFAVSTAMAGQMPTGITSPPPTQSEASATGQMPTGITSPSPSPDASLTGEMPFGATSAIDPVTEFTLSLLQSLLSLF
jgi:hypothetical protein